MCEQLSGEQAFKVARAMHDPQDQHFAIVDLLED